MPVFKLARFEVRAEARDAAERAMHDYATYVRNELPDSTWTTYRDPATPSRYLSLIIADSPAADERHHRAEGTRAFLEALRPLLAGDVELTDWQLVTSSDLARRPDRASLKSRMRTRGLRR